MTETTERLGLPLLSSGQAQKEITHNEALTLLTIATQATVVAIAPASVPASPIPGQCWIVGSAPSGAWAGKAHHLACWTTGGWRFVSPFPGMQVWNTPDSQAATFSGTDWQNGVVKVAEIRVGSVKVIGGQQSAIGAPSGGTTVDAEARTSLSAILAALRTHGLIAT